jgi:hypothetical protein
MQTKLRIIGHTCKLGAKELVPWSQGNHMKTSQLSKPCKVHADDKAREDLDAIALSIARDGNRPAYLLRTHEEQDGEYALRTLVIY